MLDHDSNCYGLLIANRDIPFLLLSENRYLQKMPGYEAIIENLKAKYRDWEDWDRSIQKAVWDRCAIGFTRLVSDYLEYCFYPEYEGQFPGVPEALASLQRASTAEEVKVLCQKYKKVFCPSTLGVPLYYPFLFKIFKSLSYRTFPHLVMVGYLISYEELSSRAIIASIDILLKALYFQETGGLPSIRSLSCP